VLFEVSRDRPEMDFDDDDEDGGDGAGGDAEGEEEGAEAETVPHAPFLVVVSKKVRTICLSVCLLSLSVLPWPCLTPAHACVCVCVCVYAGMICRRTAWMWARLPLSAWRTTTTSSSTASCTTRTPRCVPPPTCTLDTAAHTPPRQAAEVCVCVCVCMFERKVGQSHAVGETSRVPTNT
jgi:hypothetical protein